RRGLLRGRLPCDDEQPLCPQSGLIHTPCPYSRTHRIYRTHETVPPVVSPAGGTAYDDYRPMTNVSLPEEFIRTIRRDIPNDADTLLGALDGTPPVSVRWNPYKTSAPPAGEAVPWNRYGRYLPGRPSFTTDPLFHAGAYYVQEASSMFVEHLV